MSGQQDVIYLDVDGLKRRYVMYRPDSVVMGGELAPAVIMLDGRGGTPWTAMKATRLNQKADKEGFVVIYPEATRIEPDGPLHFLTNPQMWNAGVGSSDAERPHVNDTLFLERVLRDIPNRARVDAKRIYMTGFSNGAVMTYRFALKHPDILAAIAPVAGHVRVHDETLAEPVPMIFFFGRLDPLSPYDGGEIELPWGRKETRPPVMHSVHTWAILCGHLPDDGRLETGEHVSRLRYGQKNARDEIEFVTVHDLGHVWPGGHRLLPEKLVGVSSDTVCATDEMWSFFARHQRT